MRKTIELARKKVVILAAGICMYSLLLSMLPAAAVRHGIHAVWVVLPLCLIQMVAFVFLLTAFKELQTLKKTGGQHGLQ